VAENPSTESLLAEENSISSPSPEISAVEMSQGAESAGPRRKGRTMSAKERACPKSIVVINTLGRQIMRVMDQENDDARITSGFLV
jgi:hypothetical protein